MWDDAEILAFLRAVHEPVVLPEMQKQLRQLAVAARHPGLVEWSSGFDNEAGSAFMQGRFFVHPDPGGRSAQQILDGMQEGVQPGAGPVCHQKGRRMRCVFASTTQGILGDFCACPDAQSGKIILPGHSTGGAG